MYAWLDSAGKDWSSGKGLWTATAVVFVASFVALSLLYLSSPLLYDNDSYFHLAVAREQPANGFADELPAVRYGLYGRSFGDKEFLFHLLLTPFAGSGLSVLGGRVALALFGAGILTAIGNLALRAVGAWGLLVPVWLAFGSAQFTWRLVRLRPELLALLLLLLALTAVARRRWFLLACLSAALALSYVAFHAFVGVCVLAVVAAAWAERRWSWRLALAPIIGMVAGVLVHPHFPNNLKIWWFVAYEYFSLRGTLDVGTEIEPATTSVALIVNAGWLAGLWLLWRSRRQDGAPPAFSGRPHGRFAIVFGVAAVVFGGLYLMMSRFALYFVPLATLWLLFEIGRRGGLERSLRLPWRGRLPAAVGWLAVFLIALPIAWQELGRYRYRTAAGPNGERIAERQSFRAALPDGANVLATWRSATLYVFLQPKARYLNVLDPGLLATVDPDVHRAQEEIFAGVEPDVPVRALADTASEFVALSVPTAEPRFLSRLSNDPRAAVLHRAINAVYGFAPSPTAPFLLDWQVLEEDGPRRRYPRNGDPALRELEGYVDARRVDDGGESCTGFEHRFTTAGTGRLGFEFAPYGPSSLWLDDELLAQTTDDRQAVLGEGLIVAPTLESGEHHWTVWTCPDRATGTYSGFYFMRRRVAQS